MKSTNNSKRSKSSIPKPWPWPFQRYSDGPEFECPHGVGHSQGVHGCEGCCNDSSFVKAVNKWNNQKS
jgi:hypothetical protein